MEADILSSSHLIFLPSIDDIMLHIYVKWTIYSQNHSKLKIQQRMHVNVSSVPKIS